MTFKTDDRVHETSTTSGTVTYALDGAEIGKAAFSAMGASNTCPYFAEDGTNWEVGIGTILTSPSRLERTTILRSSNADAAVNWGGGTVDIRCGWPADYALDRTLSKSVAGSANVTLTTDESHRAQLTFTGTLTGNINTIVDDTPRRWSAYNNTTGAYTLTHKTSAGTGIAVPQGYRTILECDGTNVVLPINWLNNLKLGGALTVDGASTLTGAVTLSRINPAGTGVGINVTPTAWQAATSALELGTVGNALWSAGPCDFRLLSGAYYASSDWKYAVSGAAVSKIELVGNVQVSTANSGTAGNSITWTAGPYVATGGTSWTSSSDIAGKEDLRPLSVLNNLDDFQLYEYLRKSSGRREIGVIR